LNIRLPFF